MFADQYRITEEIKKGTYIRTCMATDREGNKVVVKELSLRNVDDWKTIQLFEREAELYKSLRHPRIPVYRDLIQEEREDNTFYYLVYEYREGQSLQELLDKGEIFPYDKVRQIMIQVLEILDYMHGLATPVVHRDINPKNIILDNDTVYLVDFGVGKKLAAEQDRGNTYVGTYGYMPFEQMVGDAGPKSDLYALGMTAIHLLTGRQPSLFEMQKMKPVYIKEDRMQKLDHVIDRMIEPDPADRAESAARCISWLKDNRRLSLSGKANTAGGALDAGRIKYWQSGDASFLVCRKSGRQTGDGGDGVLRFWRDHPLICIIALSVITGGPLFPILFFLRFSRGHRRWLNRRLNSGEEVSIIADSHSIQVPGQINPISRKRLSLVELHTFKNNDGTENLEVKFISRGGNSESCYIQGLVKHETVQVADFVNNLVKDE